MTVYRWAMTFGPSVFGIIETTDDYHSIGYPGGANLNEDPTGIAVIGGTWDGTTFHDPSTPTAQMQLPSILSRLTTLEGATIPSAYTSNPAALAASASPGSVSQWAKGDHVHALPGWTVATPSRALNGTAWQPSTTKWSLCMYTVSLSVVTTIGGGQDGKIELMSDSATTPTTVRATARLRQVATLAVTLQLDQNQTQQLVYMCPPAHYVRLPSTQTTGTPTLSLLNSVEIAFG